MCLIQLCLHLASSVLDAGCGVHDMKSLALLLIAYFTTIHQENELKNDIHTLVGCLLPSVSPGQQLQTIFLRRFASRLPLAEALNIKTLIHVLFAQLLPPPPPCTPPPQAPPTAEPRSFSAPRKAATPPWEPYKRIPKQNDMLEIEHLAAELVGVGVDKDELVGEVPSEDGMRDSHSHDADTSWRSCCGAWSKREESRCLLI
ncbi:hypothetical protein JHK86_022775 [Glycine max]|nr:hypothetical protein JHK86_022775 [Glycine max]